MSKNELVRVSDDFATETDPMLVLERKLARLLEIKETIKQWMEGEYPMLEDALEEAVYKTRRQLKYKGNLA